MRYDASRGLLTVEALQFTADSVERPRPVGFVTLTSQALMQLHTQSIAVRQRAVTRWAGWRIRARRYSADSISHQAVKKEECGAKVPEKPASEARNGERLFLGYIENVVSSLLLTPFSPEVSWPFRGLRETGTIVPSVVCILSTYVV